MSGLAFRTEGDNGAGPVSHLSPDAVTQLHPLDIIFSWITTYKRERVCAHAHTVMQTADTVCVITPQTPVLSGKVM